MSWIELIDSDDIPGFTAKLNDNISDIEERFDFPMLENVTPLIYAVSKNKTEFVQLLLENDADVDAHDDVKYTALHRACINDNLESVAMLLLYKPNINFMNYFDLRALSYAKSNEVARILIENGSDISGFTTETGYSVSDILIKDKFADIIKQVDLENDAKDPLININRLKLNNNVEYVEPKINFKWAQVIDDQDTAAITAYLTSNPTLVNQFFKIPNTTIWYTPLSYACFSNKIDLIDFLLSYGAIDMIDLDGNTILMQLVIHSISNPDAYFPIFEKLVNSNSNISHINTSGQSPMVLAIKFNNFKLAALLESAYNRKIQTLQTNIQNQQEMKIKIKALDIEINSLENKLDSRSADRIKQKSKMKYLENKIKKLQKSISEKDAIIAASANNNEDNKENTSIMMTTKEDATHLLLELPEETPQHLKNQKMVLVQNIAQFNEAVKEVSCIICMTNIKQYAAECGHLYCHGCISYYKQNIGKCEICKLDLGEIRRIQ